MGFTISGGVQIAGGSIVISPGGSSPSPGGAYSFQGSNYGYTTGGDLHPTPGDRTSNIIDKFSFSSDGNATDIGDLSVTQIQGTGQSSTASGYASGGQINDSVSDTTNIEKFPFASDSNGTDVGDLTAGRFKCTAGQQY